MIATRNASYLDTYESLECNNIDEINIIAEAYQKALQAWDKANIRVSNSKSKTLWIEEYIKNYINN